MIPIRRTIACRSLGHGSAGTPSVAVFVAEVDDNLHLQ